MTVQLWACRNRFGASMPCQGWRYTEVGEDPGPCGQETLKTTDGMVVRTCQWPMDLIGEFEVEFA